MAVKRDGADVMSSGRVFQSLGAVAANDRSPIDTTLDEGTKRSSEVDDQRRVLRRVCVCVIAVRRGQSSSEHRPRISDVSRR